MGAALIKERNQACQDEATFDPPKVLSVFKKPVSIPFSFICPHLLINLYQSALPPHHTADHSAHVVGRAHYGGVTGEDE